MLSHLPQITNLARRIASQLPPRVDASDLVSAGVIGFMTALARYNPKRGAQLRTFAEFRIRGAMLDCLRESDWAPRGLRKQTRILGSTCSALERKLGRTPTPDELCAEMRIRLDDLNRLVFDLQGAAVGSLDEDPKPEVGHNRECLLQSLACPAQSLPSALCQASEVRDILAAAIDTLPRQQHLVVSLRYYDELNVVEIAGILGVSSSRVSQLHSKALKALRVLLSPLELAA